MPRKEEVESESGGGDGLAGESVDRVEGAVEVEAEAEVTVEMEAAVEAEAVV